MTCDRSSRGSRSYNNDSAAVSDSSGDKDDFLSKLSSTDLIDITDKTFSTVNDFFNTGNAYADRFETEFLDKWRGFGPRGFRRFGNTSFEPSKVPEGLTVSDSSFQVPSFRRYNRCLDANGVSAWDRQGVWNCLIPKDPAFIKNLGLDPGRSTKLEDRSWFRDYTVYLDWRRAMYKAMSAKEERERQASFNSRSSEVIVTDDDAQRQGKSPVATTSVTKDFTDENGQLGKRTVVKKFYGDGTKSVTETVEINGQVQQVKNDSGGWFWRGSGNK